MKIILAVVICFMLAACGREVDVVVVISADAEWRALTNALGLSPAEETPYGAAFRQRLRYADGPAETVVMHGGWGKTDAAGSMQYAIDRFAPRLVVNLGTCGGFAGLVEKGDVVVATNALQYDIHEMMGDSAEAIAYYSVPLADGRVTGKPVRPALRRARIVSADRDLDPATVPELARRYGAVAGDWETASLAHVARKNGVAFVALRSVSDVVTAKGSETYGDFAAFERACREQMLVLYGLLTNIRSGK